VSRLGPRKLAGALALGAVWVALGGARDPILVPEVSQHDVVVRQGFTGTQLLLYGALLGPEGTRAGADYDIVIVVEGPSRAVTLREKRKIAGVWVNADATTLRSMPSYYAVASNRPLAQIVDERTAAIYEMGLGALQLSPSGSYNPDRQEHFAQGLVGVMRAKGLFQQDEHAVSITGGVLYSARIAMPSSLHTGTYTAETFAIHKGRVVASALAQVKVSKQGFEKAVVEFSRRQAFSYGLLAVSFSVLMGWLAGRLFARG